MKSCSRVLVLAVLCLYGLANVGCAGFSTAKTGTVTPPATQFSISGSISPTLNGAGVTVSLSGDSFGNTTTDSSGNYSFSGLPAGSYTLIPTKAGYGFNPSARQVVVTASITGSNFSARSTLPPPSPISISGTIGPAANGAGVTVSLSGDALATATTDSSGNYSFGGLFSGSYTITPTKAGYGFSPSTQQLTVTASVVNTNFTASPDVTPPISISGTISPAANGVGVSVSLGGDASATTTADSSGNYRFSGLSGGSYTIAPTKAGYSFSPSSRQLTVTTSVANTNFTASSSVKQSGPIVINGQNGTVIEGLRITSNSGDCVKILNSTNITIQNSEIGPCAGNGIKISGGSGINVFDSYIHPETLSAGCCDHNDGIYAYGGTQNLWIQGNVIGYGEDNIQVDAATGVQVVGNFLLNPRNYAGSNGARGHQFQSWKNSSSVTVSNNYTVSSGDLTAYLYAGAVQDAVNFGQTTTFSADSNFVNGGQSPYGCAIIADTTTNDGSFTHNLVLDSGDCGIEISSGNNNTMDHNKVLNRNPTSDGEQPVALSVWASYYSRTGETCSSGTVTNNIAAAQQVDGSYSNGLFAPTSGPSSCSPVTNSGNILNSAAVTLLTTPSVSAVFPTPLIPPQPKNCVAISPYSTQNSAAACVP